MCSQLVSQSSLELARWAVALAVPALAGLGGVVAGAYLTSRRERRQRKLGFVEKQLSLFYSPMLGLRNEVHAYSSLRVRVQSEAQAAWAQIVEDTRNLPPHEQHRITAQKGPEFSKLIQFDDDRLRKDLLPSYRRVLELFRENYWLADPETRDFYPAVLEFVDIWERWEAGTLPHEVLQRLNHAEANLHPFYNHIAQRHELLRTKLVNGDA